MQEDIFERLERATRDAREQNDLPDVPAEAILGIVANREAYRGCGVSLKRLADMLSEYDTYAQTGYLGMGVNDADIRMQLKAVEGERAAEAAASTDNRG